MIQRLTLVFVRTFVIICGLLVTCEVAHADIVPTTCLPGGVTTPGGVVTCTYNAQLGGGENIVNQIDPGPSSVLIGSKGGTATKVTIASTQELVSSATGQGAE